mmetsp:Transcript_16377/g.33476  ORF Transcript_16377/g.33476 Transcript_16377/m.33476 type:complete len:528 (-) Transcript_16377:61-1644(-)
MFVRESRIRPVVHCLILALPSVTAIAVQLYIAGIVFSALLPHPHHSIEGFSSLSIPEARNSGRTRNYVPSSQSRTFVSPYCSILSGNMESRRDGDYDKQASKQKDPNRGEPTANAAPLYITIGPQCCGKSSFLRKYKGGKIKDICLDDQKDVYVPISTETFLSAYEDSDAGGKFDDKAQSVLQQVYQGKTLLERIRENIELMLILRRWNGDLSPSDFADRIRSFYQKRNFKTGTAETLITAVEGFLSTEQELPQETDVFVLESLFKPHPETRKSAIQRAHEELRKTPRHIPVAWGNTNGKARDYEQALEICHQLSRPVRFVLSHPGYGNRGVDNSSDDESKLLTLPWVSLEDLLKRNLHRLQKEGRFIPAFAIADLYQRVPTMVPRNFFESSDDTGRDMNIEKHLVSIASPGSGRNDNGRSRPLFRYLLTAHRLVQKQYPQNNKGYPSTRQRQTNQNRNRRRDNGQRHARPSKKPKSQDHAERDARHVRQSNDSNDTSRHDNQGRRNQHERRQYTDYGDPRSRSSFF